jgi:hypothetical protein
MTVFTTQPYSSIKASIERVVRVFANTHPGLSYMHWDGRDTKATLEPGLGDLIGPTGISVQIEPNGVFDITFSVGVSTIQDENGFKMSRLIDEAVKLFPTSSGIPLFDFVSKQEIGSIYTFYPIDVNALSSAEQRAFTMITFSCSTNQLQEF